MKTIEIAKKVEQKVESMSDKDIEHHLKAEKQSIVEVKVNQEIIDILRKYEINPDFTTIECEADIYDTSFLKELLITDRENYCIEDEDELSEESVTQVMMLAKYAHMVIIPLK